MKPIVLESLQEGQNHLQRRLCLPAIVGARIACMPIPMPTQDFKCPACGKINAVILQGGPKDPLFVCPDCGFSMSASEDRDNMAKQVRQMAKDEP